MKFSISWLKKHLDTTATVEEIETTLNTIIGLEVEEVEDKAEALAPFVIAKVVTAEPHPDSDHLNVLSVDNGSGENLQVVCGAPNAKAGLWGVFAGAGVYVPGIDFTLSKVKIRGVESNGMMCSEKELLISDEHEGIIELEGDDFTAGESYVERFSMSDPVVDVEITPNRGDCCGVRGLARDLAAAGLGTLKPMEIADVKSEIPNPISITIEDEKDCPLFIGRYVKGVKNGKSTEEMQKLLKSIGAKTLSALVDITNYSTFDVSRPLHVFDADKISGNLVVRRAKDGEKMVGIDDAEYTLDPTMIIIADDNGVQSIAGIMGGKDTSCDENTKNVYIECAFFNEVPIAYTGRKTGIQSDARYRFERELDAGFAPKAIEYATQMVIDLCGGTPSELCVAGKMNLENRTMEYSPSRCLTLGGVDIDEAKQIEILEKLEFGVAKKGDLLEITIPTWRNDIGNGGQADIVEEVLRMHGYTNIPSVALPREEGITKSKVSPRKQREITARRSLAAQGLSEAITFTFTDEKIADKFGGVKDAHKIINPVSSELGVLRPSILCGLLPAVARNQSRGATNVSLFETGSVFRKDNAEQSTETCGIISGLNNDKHWLADSREVDVFDIKETLETLIKNIGAPIGRTTNGALDYYHPGRSGTIALGKNPIAYFGEIHPAVLQELGIKTRVVAFELLLDNIPEAKKKSSTKPKLETSKFQATTRDFAFVLDSDVPAANLIQAVKKADKLITDVEIFDVYEGANLGENKKSLAIKVKIEPKSGTLTDKELELISSAIILNVGKQVGGAIRS